MNRRFQLRASVLPSDAGERSILLLSGGLGSTALRGEVRSALRILFLLTGLAVALACVNVASLAAVKSAAREKEISIRLALGARRSRLSRQLLTEGLVLAGLGGIVGLLAAPWLARALVSTHAPRLVIDGALEPLVLAFGLAVSLVAALVVAFPPVRAAGRAGGHVRRFAVQDAVASLQIAMALAILVVAALLVQSVRRFQSVDPGFRADGLVIARLDPRTAGYSSDRIDDYWRDVLDRWPARSRKRVAAGDGATGAHAAKAALAASGFRRGA